jgi:hypothetical protein
MREVSTTESSSQAEWQKWGAVALFVAWLFFCLGAYYVANKPFTPDGVSALIEKREVWSRLAFSAGAVSRALLDVGTVLWFVFIALGTGVWLLLPFRSLLDSDLELVVYSLGLGFGLLGMVTLALGLLGLLQPSTFYAVAILLTIVAAPKALPILRRFRLPRPSPAVVIYLILAVGLALVIALLPPTSWDSLFYHLKGPKLYLDAGGIEPGIDIPHLNFPSLFEMLFMMAMAIRGDVAAKLLHFVFNFMLVGVVYAMARNQLKVKNGWTAVLFLYAMPMVLVLATWAYNDLALAFYQVVALYGLINWQRSQRDEWLILLCRQYWWRLHGT